MPSVLVLVVGLAVTVTLTVGSVVSIHDAEDRLLRSQLSQVGAALQAALPAIQQPLVAADRIAGTVGVTAFRTFARSDAGPGAPFRSITLWRRANGGVSLVARVGAPPTLLAHPALAERQLARAPARTVLTVTALRGRRVEGLGLVERLPESPGLLVYAETRFETGPSGHVSFPAGSPFAGLTFALYFGRSIQPGSLMETSIALPPHPPTGSSVVPFGSALVTIVSSLGSKPGVLPPSVPWLIGVGGSVLTVAATAATERLVRRQELAERVARERGAQYDQQRGIAQTLQHSLLPDGGSPIDGVEVAGRYVSGTEALDVGGDWYDVVRVDDGHLVIAVGDVSGRGLRAATVMGSLRHAIRAYAVQRDDPATIIRKLDELVDVGRDRCFATVLCVAIDVEERRLELASAGHLPALLLDDSGARFVDAPVNTPVGVQSAAAVSSTSLTVAPGAALVVYTDGLVERRDRSLDVGMERLRTVVATPPGAIEDVVASIVPALLPEGATDDLALLGVRFDRVATAGPIGGGAHWAHLGTASTTWSRRFENTPGSAASARAFTSTATAFLPEEARELVTLLVSELATNAMLHASSPFEVTVVADEVSRRVRVGVRDHGTGTPVRQRPRPLAPRGRGLRIVDELSTRWGVEWAEDGRSKTVWFELDAPTHQGADVPATPRQPRTDGFSATSGGHDRRQQ